MTQQRTARRQARGQRRIEEIVQAAAGVFADAGYEAATTNAIAAAAGISPGSLYQFFANKDEVARALAERYVTELGAAQAEAFDGADIATAPLDELIARVVAPLVEFNLANRGFKALFARADMPPSMTEAVAPLHAALLERVESLLRARAPRLPDNALRRVSMVAIQLVRAMMPLIVDADGEEREALVAELRTALHGYLADALG